MTNIESHIPQKIDAAGALDRISTAIDQLKPDLDDPFVKIVAATVAAAERGGAPPPLLSDVPMGG